MAFYDWYLPGKTQADPTQTAYEPVNSKQNSLTQFLRSQQNLLAKQGSQAFGTGQDILGTGKGIIDTGAGITAAGGQDYATKINAAAPALDYLTRLVRGDQADVAQATAPQTDQIQKQFGEIRNMISAQPRGGGKTSVLAELPTQEAEAKTNLQSQARSGAAGQLGGLASTLAGLGISQEGVGLGQQQVGLGEQGVGLGESGLGANMSEAALRDALERRGQNLQEDAQNKKMLEDLGISIGKLLTAQTPGGGMIIKNLFGGGGG